MRLLGCEGELDEVDHRLRAGRVVTVVGPGGVGKTALASEAVKRAAGRFARGSRNLRQRVTTWAEPLTPTRQAPYQRRPTRWENDDGQRTNQTVRPRRQGDTTRPPCPSSARRRERRNGRAAGDERQSCKSRTVPPPHAAAKAPGLLGTTTTGARTRRPTSCASRDRRGRSRRRRCGLERSDSVCAGSSAAFASPPLRARCDQRLG